MILSTGGIAHLITAIQKSQNHNDSEATQAGVKAIHNLLTHRNPLVKLLIAELGHLDTIMTIVRQMYQTVMKSAAQEVGRTERSVTTRKRNEVIRPAIVAGIELLEVIAGAKAPSQNKRQLIEQTSFLSFCNRMVLLSIDKP